MSWWDAIAGSSDQRAAVAILSLFLGAVPAAVAGYVGIAIVTGWRRVGALTFALVGMVGVLLLEIALLCAEWAWIADEGLGVLREYLQPSRTLTIHFALGVSLYFAAMMTHGALRERALERENLSLIRRRRAASPRARGADDQTCHTNHE